jgi:Fe-Mn family superoxide dismutase
MTFTEKQFTIRQMEGISEKTIVEHLKLYSGYVKHANLILTKIKELTQADAEGNAYAIAEMQRRFGFEFDGMRNHEFYFEQFEGTASTIDNAPTLKSEIEKQFESVDQWQNRFKTIAMTRGIGWAILYYDKKTKSLLNAWIDEQHLGHLTGLDVILALDMWEHSYMLDYVPSEKKKYVEAFFNNIDWNLVDKRYTTAVSQV